MGYVLRVSVQAVARFAEDTTEMIDGLPPEAVQKRCDEIKYEVTKWCKENLDDDAEADVAVAVTLTKE